MLFLLLGYAFLIAFVLFVVYGFIFAGAYIFATVPLTGFFVVFVTQDYAEGSEMASNLMIHHPILITLVSVVVLIIVMLWGREGLLGFSTVVAHFGAMLVFETMDDASALAMVVGGIIAIPLSLVIWVAFIHSGTLKKKYQTEKKIEFNLGRTVLGKVFGGVTAISQVAMYWCYTLGNGTSMGDGTVLAISIPISVVVVVGIYIAASKMKFKVLEEVDRKAEERA